MTICFKNDKIIMSFPNSSKTGKKPPINIPAEDIGTKIRNSLVEAKTVLQLLEKHYNDNKNIKDSITSALEALSAAVFLSLEINKDPVGSVHK